VCRECTNTTEWFEKGESPRPWPRRVGTDKSRSVPSIAPRVERHPGLIGLHRDRVVEQAETRADRGFVVGKGIVGETHSRTVVFPRGIGMEYVRYVLKSCARGVIRDCVEPAEALGGVGIKLPAESGG
jgi:hypothetical protein